jgi:hypothetical protein
MQFQKKVIKYISSAFFEEIKQISMQNASIFDIDHINGIANP